MTTPCRFCDTNTTVHKSNCPEVAPNPEVAKRDWDEGYRQAYDNGKSISGWVLEKYKTTWFQRGYAKGKALADKEADDAFQAQYSFHSGEY